MEPLAAPDAELTLIGYWLGPDDLAGRTEVGGPPLGRKRAPGSAT
jgi:hypothetical protein